MTHSSPTLIPNHPNELTISSDFSGEGVEGLAEPTPSLNEAQTGLATSW